MTVVQKTVKIPPSRLISLELPADVPAGNTAIVTINIPPKIASEKSLLDLAGVLAGSKTFMDDSVDSIRKIRDEW